MTDKVGDSSARKLFVGEIARETTEESLRKHFSQFGEITHSVIIMSKNSGGSRGYGFVTYADSEIANKVLEKDHIIDGRAVVVKKKAPQTEIFIGGLPQSLTEDDLKKYFSSFGDVVGHRIMLDRKTGRSKGFGFVTFDNEEAVEKVLANGCMHELGGKQVEIKRAKPKRVCAELTSENLLHHGGSILKSHRGDCGSVEGFGGAYGGTTGAGHGGYGGYEGYDNYDGGYGKFPGSYGAGPWVFYPVYGGYSNGFGFGGAMYGSAGYGGSSYGAPVYYGGGTGGAMYGAAGYGGSSYGVPVYYVAGTGGAMYGAAGYGGSSYGVPVYYAAGTGGAMYGGSSYGSPVYYGGDTGYASSNGYANNGGNPAGYDNANTYDTGGSSGDANAL